MSSRTKAWAYASDDPSAWGRTGVPLVGALGLWTARGGGAHDFQFPVASALNTRQYSGAATVARLRGLDVVRLGQINIVVRDMEAMSAFYERLGVPMQRGLSQWAPHHRNTGSSEAVDIDLDSDEFAALWNEGWPGGGGVVLGFRVDSREEVDRLYEDLTAAGHRGQQPPYDAFWGSRYAVVADPDGNSVGLMSAPDDARRRRPPPPPS